MLPTGHPEGDVNHREKVIDFGERVQVALSGYPIQIKYPLLPQLNICENRTGERVPHPTNKKISRRQQLIKIFKIPLHVPPDEKQKFLSVC